MLHICGLVDAGKRFRKLQTGRFSAPTYSPPRQTEGSLWYPAFPSPAVSIFCSPRVHTEQRLSSRILLVGGKQQEVASYKTQGRL